MSVLTVKIISSIVLWTVTFAFGILPLPVLHCMDKNIKTTGKLDTIIGLLNCFAGGVFLGTLLLSLIPEAIEIVEQAIPSEYESLPGVLIGAGFFLVMHLEYVIEKFNSNGVNLFHNHDNSLSKMDNNNQLEQETTSKPNVFVLSDNTQTHSESEEGDSAPETGESTKGENSSQSTVQISENLSDIGQRVKFSTVIMFMILSVHMIFEGMAIGVQASETKVWATSISLSVHKCAIAFSMGLNLKQSVDHKSYRIYLYILLFASMSPVGVAIGMGIYHCDVCGSSSKVTSGVLQSLTSGIFLYITFFEILQKEVKHNGRFVNVFLCLIGFAVTASLNTVH